MPDGNTFTCRAPDRDCYVLKLSGKVDFFFENVNLTPRIQSNLPYCRSWTPLKIRLKGLAAAV